MAEKTSSLGVAIRIPNEIKDKWSNLKKEAKKYSRTTGKSKGKQEEVQDLSQYHRPWKALSIFVRTVLPSHIWMGLIHVFK